MENTKPINDTYKSCSCCIQIKTIDQFYSKKNICKECFNFKRREKYKNNEEHRKKLINLASDFKHKKVLQNQIIKQENQIRIGLNNTQCKYCKEIKDKNRFRHNRLKCKDCERDEPIEKFKRYIRTRIYNCLRNKKKSIHSVEYLGCSSDEYFKWIFSYNDSFVLQNHGKVWHIDHVIPISKFDLNDEMQQLIAFNWRNTMPLYSRDNLSKNNKIIKEQIENHYKKVIEYHLENKLDLPQVYINLFAKYLVAGSPLEPILSNK